jgi:hypothetical protein
MKTNPHSNQQSSTEETHLEFSLKQIAVHAPASAKCPATPKPKSESFMALQTPTAASRSKLNLLGNGFLRRCQTGLFIGATGIGKSVAIAQAVFSWAVGRCFFGIKPQEQKKGSNPDFCYSYCSCFLCNRFFALK